MITDAAMWVLILLILIVAVFGFTTLAYLLAPLLDRWIEILERLQKKWSKRDYSGKNEDSRR